MIPVYNEGESIQRVLKALDLATPLPFSILLCYDRDNDTTLPAAQAVQKQLSHEIRFIKNKYAGAHGAVRSGMEASTADAVVTYMADDDFNVALLEPMIEALEGGADMVVPSRFMKGGVFEGCRFPKNVLVQTASWTLYLLAGLPVHDATNGFRLFSRRLLDRVQMESTEGFTYSLELLAKCHRLGWRIVEIPARWYERQIGQSRFRVFRWAKAYLTWYWYTFRTTYLHARQVH